MKEYFLSVEKVLSNLNSSSSGLTDSLVNLSMKKYGKNQLTKTKGKSLIKRIFDALFEPMIVILLIAVMITLGVNIGKVLKGGNGDFYECIGIVLAIVISVALTVIMEGKSQKTFELLNKVSSNTLVKVRRNGKVTLIPQTQIVVGDIIIIESGDKIIADGRLIKSQNLEVDESTLTGESMPVKKDHDIILPENTPVADRENCVYSGTFVTSGEGEMVVTAVGDNAEIGVISTELQAKNAISAPLQEKLDKLGKTVAWLGGISAGFVFILTVTRLFITSNVSFDTLQDAFLNSIVLIVASVPEGLPTTVAIALSLNVVKLYKSNALIKKLVATETVGSVSVICSDKTGTLTENKMKVLKVFYGDRFYGENSFNNPYLAINMAINSTAEITDGKRIGQPTETCLLEFLMDNGKFDYSALRLKYQIKSRTPFSSAIKFMSTTVYEDVEYLKGAPEVILNFCDISNIEKGEILKRITIEQENARRVLAFCHKEKDKTYFDGFAVIADSVRKDVFSAVSECKRAGISVKMLTGDNFATAYSIAYELDIIKDKTEVVNAFDIDSLPDEKLKSLLPNIKVVARSTPKTKLRIVKLLKEMGEVVAVTGDGINDAPAIKHADIGIAMGGGSEITKEASDIVLLDNSFSTIIKAISFGRNIFQNFRRFITFQLSVNVTAVTFIISSLILGLENPFTTLQLLWINIIMDGPPALTLGLEKGDGELMNNKPTKRNDSLVSKKMLFRIIINSVYMCFVLIAQYRYNFIGCTVEQLSTVMFSLFIIFQLFNAFNCRELGSKSVVKSLNKNKPMVIVFLITFVIQIVLSECFGGLFKTVPLGFNVWIKTILTALSVVVISELYKLSYKIVTKNNKIYKKSIKTFN